MTREITLREAIHQVTASAMARDPRVFLMGEDMTNWGGGFRMFTGLEKRFPTQVFDTPLAESAIAGAATGAALMDTRPIALISYGDFLPIAMDHVVNSAAKIRYQHGGDTGCPVVFVVPTGGGLHYGMHHSQSVEAWFMHVPGLRVVLPSTPADAAGLLLSAIRHPDPVLFFVPKVLLDVRGVVADPPLPVPIGRARIARDGSDVSVITVGSSVAKALDAADVLAALGISIEVIDLRSLSPLDDETMLASVRKTEHVVVVHEGCRTGGIGAEVAARLSEKGFWHLERPIERVASPDIPVPFSPALEVRYLPQTDQIVEAVQRLFAEEV
jgi:pyruvate dehydrogenase E1 component beta subunit